MKRSLLLTAALAVFTLGAAGWIAPSYTFESSSKIWVEGTSTIHDWECEVGQFAGSVTADAAEAGFASLTATSLAVPVQGIDCDNGTMNGKLRDALGSTPVRYDLASADVGEVGADGWFTINTTGRLTIAGATQPVEMSVKAKALDGNRFRFVGQHALKMTDYGVDPPTAMFGTLKTGDEVTVHFDATVSG
jgi:polyisoprenoid-binding protein YceI